MQHKKIILYLNSVLFIVAVFLGVNTFSVRGHQFIQKALAAIGAISGEGTINLLARFVDDAQGQATTHYIGNSSIYDTGAGYVGIKTITPDSELDVESDDDDDIFRIKRSTAANPVIHKSGADSAYVLNVGGGDRMTIKNDGKVGIGTTGPTAPLSVSSSTAGVRVNSWIDVNSSACGLGSIGQNVYLNQADNISRWSNTHPTIGGSMMMLGTCSGPGYNDIVFLRASGPTGSIPTIANGVAPMLESMRISSTGNVGIGSLTPTAKLSFGNVVVDSVNGITWYDSGPLWYGIYRTSGPWIANTYQQLKVSWQTGIVLDPGTFYDKSYVDIQGAMRLEPRAGDPPANMLINGLMWMRL